MLVIAHRMRTVAGADKIVVLADGAVAEQGTPQKLTAKNGIFKRMSELLLGCRIGRVTGAEQIVCKVPCFCGNFADNY